MIELNWYITLLIIAAGFLAGFINTLAGSGSLITVPLLMFLGLPANVANATNRVMIFLSFLVGVSSFKQQKVFKVRENISLALPAIIGAIIGAKIAVDINELILTRIIGGLMVVMLVIIIYKPQRWLSNPMESVKPKFTIVQYVVMFFIGLYGGFIQIGVGLFLLSGLVLSVKYNLVKANAVKMLIVLVYTAFALGIFIYSGQVNFLAGILLAVGSMLGAYLATKVAVKWGPKFVRVVLITVVSLAAFRFLGIYDFIKTLFI